MDYEYLTSRIDGQVAVVSLNRAPVNAVHHEMYQEIGRLFRSPDDLGRDVRVIILAGEGPHFCAGNDLDEFERMDEAMAVRLMFQAREAFHAIYSCPVPVLAAVHGSALGTGLAIAASCDMVLAAEGARFGLPELQVGVAGGAKHLSRLVPQGMMRRMFFTADPVTAEEMRTFGGVIEVVSGDQLLERAMEIALRIARHSPSAVHDAKRVLNNVEFLDLRRGYEMEQQVTIARADHPDSKEAVTAFREKRSPQ